MSEHPTLEAVVAAKATYDERVNARAELDAAVRAASESGVSYRQIASAIGLSVAWVQQSLQRTAEPLEAEVAAAAEPGESP